MKSKCPCCRLPLVPKIKDDDAARQSGNNEDQDTDDAIRDLLEQAAIAAMLYPPIPVNNPRRHQRRSDDLSDLMFNIFVIPVLVTLLALAISAIWKHAFDDYSLLKYTSLEPLVSTIHENFTMTPDLFFANIRSICANSRRQTSVLYNPPFQIAFSSIFALGWFYLQTMFYVFYAPYKIAGIINEFL